MRGLGIALAALGLVGAAGAEPGATATRFVRQSADVPVAKSASGGLVSSNWAGYAVADATTSATAAPPADPGAAVPATPTSFTSVTGTWTQPKATCMTGSAAYSSVWVGLGGFGDSSQALEQIGTEADCTAAGKATYNAWYELVPAPSVELPLKIGSGDTITTSVNVAGTSVLLQIKDRTRRTSYTKRFTFAAPDLSSADWIVEAPSRCDGYGSCETLPLANFGSVTFTRIATTGNSHPGTLSDPAWLATPIQLLTGAPSYFAPDAPQSGAAPAELSADGRSFTVAWQPTAG